MHAILNFLGRFQRMHLFTRVLVGFVFALIAWANTIPYYQDPAIVFAGYGWPFKCLELPTIVFHFLDGRRHPERSHYFYAPEFVVNLLVAFVIPALLAVLLERLVWKNIRPRVVEARAAGPASTVDAASAPPSAQPQTGPAVPEGARGQS